MSMQRGSWGPAVSVADREALAGPGRSMVGRRYGAWTILRQAGWQQVGAKRLALWRCRAECCGALAFMRSAALAKARRGRSGLCKRCYCARVSYRYLMRQALRRCVWCRRALRPHGLRECDACARRACRNGRDADGRPIGRVAYRKRPA